MGEKGRIVFIDIAKGIGIILVVLGHSNMPESVAKWIYSFHMPLFFLLSGFFARNYPFYPTIKKKIKTLLIPYIVFSIISVIVLKILGVKYFDNEITKLYSGWHTYSLWFLTTLFITEICFNLLNTYLKSKWILLVLIVLFFLIGYLLEIKSVFLWYKIEVIFTSLSWFIIGYLLNSLVAYKFNNTQTIFYFTGLSVFILSIFFSLNLPRFDMASNSLGLFPFNHFNALIGILFVILLSVKLSDYVFFTKIFTFLGTNTMIILCTHQLLIFTLKKGTSLLWEPCLADSIFRQILFWCLIPLIISIINKKLPFLIGK